MALTAHGRNRIYQAFGFSVALFYAVPAVGGIVALFTTDGRNHDAARGTDASWIWPGLFTVWYAVAAVLTVWLTRMRVEEDDDWQVDPRQAGPLMLLGLLTLTTFFALGSSFPMPWRVLPPAVAVVALVIALVQRRLGPPRSRTPPTTTPAPASAVAGVGGRGLGGVFPEPDPDLWLGPPPDVDAQAWVDQMVPDLLHRIDGLGGGTGAGARLRVDDPEGYLRAVLHRIAQARADDTDPFVRLPQRREVFPELSCVGLVRHRIDGPVGTPEVAAPEGGSLAGEPEVARVGPWQRTVQQVVEPDGSASLSARYTRRASLAPGHDVDVLVDGSAAWELREEVLDDLDELALSVRIVNAGGGTA